MAVKRSAAFMWLTPELSRAALRPWASETQWYLHEAAKRARLERIVRPVPAVLLTNEPICPESSADNRSLRNAEPRNGVPAALAGTEFVAKINNLGEAREEQTPTGLDAC